jgi:hypothetical protein
MASDKTDLLEDRFTTELLRCLALLGSLAIKEIGAERTYAAFAFAAATVKRKGQRRKGPHAPGRRH